MKANFVKFLLLFFLVFISPYASGQFSQSAVPSWVLAPDSKPVKPDLEDINDGYYIESYEYQVDLASKTRFYRTAKVIFDNAGTENAGNISVYYNPEYQKVIFHELVVLRNGVRINKLNLQKIKQLSVEDDLTRSIYNGMKSAYIIIDDLRNEDKIICSYSVQGFNGVFQNKFSDYYNLQSYEPIGQVFVAYIVPEDRQVHFKEYKDAPKPRIEKRGTNKVYTWDLVDTKKATYSYNSPSWYSSYDYIECSEYKNWKEVSDWILQINPIVAIQPITPLGQYVERAWKESKGDSYGYLTKVTDFVQNEIRYMGVEVGEYSHRANNPHRVFEQRYGDCKDKSVLLASMLKAKGIGADLVLANTSHEYGLRDRLPSPLHFNHMIVEVNVDGRHQFIDPTITNQGGNIKERYLPYYGDVLTTRVRDELIGVGKEANKRIKIVETYQLDKNYKALLTVNTIYEGGSADEIRSYFKTTAKNQVQKSYLDYYTRLYPKTKKKENIRFEDDLKNNVFKVYEVYSIEDIGTVDSQVGKRVLPLYANQLTTYIPELEPDHLGPISLQYPLSFDYSIKIVNVNGKPFDTVADNHFQERSAYSYGKHISTIGDTLKINYQFSIHSSFVEEKDVALYNEDFSNRDDLFYNGYFLAEDGGVEVISPVGSPSLLSYGILLLTLIVGLVFIIKFYHKTEPKYFVFPENNGYEESMNGWTSFLGLGLVGSLIRLLFSFFTDDYILNDNVWRVSTYLGVNSVLYNTVVVCEIIGNALVILSFGYCLVLFIQKRDIFPQTLLFTFIFNLAFIIIDTLVAHYMLPGHFSFNTIVADLFRMILFSLIWGSYILKSQNVKNVFVRKYRSNEEIVNNTLDWENIKEIE